MRRPNYFLLSLMVYALLCVGIVKAQNQNDLPSPFDMVMLSGADYSLSVQITNPADGTPVNISGYQYFAQFRSAPAPTGILFATYSTSIVNSMQGQMKVKLSKAQTANLTGKSGIWDLLQLDTSSKATFLLSGKATCKPTSTVYP